MAHKQGGYGGAGMGQRRGHNNAPGYAPKTGKGHKINEIVNETPDYGGRRETGGDKPEGYKGNRGVTDWDAKIGGNN